MTQPDLAEVAGPSEAEALNPGLLADFLGPRVRVLWNLLDARMVDALSPFGLRTGAFSALALISANPGCSQNQLAGGLGMDKSAVVAIIDELESRDLARRVRQAHDRRRHALSLTTKGKALLQRMLGPATVGGRPIREALSAKEMEQLHALLDRACRALAEAPPIGKSSSASSRIS